MTHEERLAQLRSRVEAQRIEEEHRRSDPSRRRAGKNFQHVSYSKRKSLYRTRLGNPVLDAMAKRTGVHPRVIQQAVNVILERMSRELEGGGIVPIDGVGTLSTYSKERRRFSTTTHQELRFAVDPHFFHELNPHLPWGPWSNNYRRRRELPRFGSLRALSRQVIEGSTPE